MPHLDLKYKEDKVSGELLVGAMQPLAEIIGRHFDMNPAYVSIEVKPQTSWSLNRKDVDLELSSSPDEGKRAAAARALSEELSDWIRKYLLEHGHNCEVSAWVRIFREGVYVYGAPLG